MLKKLKVRRVVALEQLSAPQTQRQQAPIGPGSLLFEGNKGLEDLDRFEGLLSYGRH